MITASLLAFAATVTPLAPMTVAELVRDHDVLIGRRVSVRGWLLAPCYKFGCALSATRRGGDHVSLGASPAFDEAVGDGVGRELIVEVPVTDHCWPTPPGSSDIVVCADRSHQVADPRLVRILR